MLKYIFIGAITRSGGSLLARMFDGHENIASYPVEMPFPRDNSYYDINENYPGTPSAVPILSKGKLSKESKLLKPSSLFISSNIEEKTSNTYDIYDLVGVPKKKPNTSIKWGHEKSDLIGVRKGYLEKSYFENVTTDFDYNKFLKNFKNLSHLKKNWFQIYNARHLAFFKSWDNGKYLSNNTRYVAMHDSGGLYLTNLEYFLKKNFGSKFIIPIRDVLGYVASEKIRMARIFFGSRRFNKPHVPLYFVKKFKEYDLNAQILNWSTAVTRSRLLQEKYGFNKNILVYSHENLIKNTDIAMKAFANKLGIKFNKILCEPTIGNRPWKGNSHYGRVSGVNSFSNENYKKVLTSNEIAQILKKVGKLRNIILKKKDTFLNLTNIDPKYFQNYYYQKKYFNDKTKISLYYSLVSSNGRKITLRKPNLLSLLSIFFSMYVRIYNIPRLLKLKFFPGRGKQNYT